MFAPATKRVLIARNYWTPFRNELFDGRFDVQDEDNAAALYDLLYDRAYHRLVPIVKEPLTNLSKLSGLDRSDLKACLRELREKRLVRLGKKSDSHRGSGELRLEMPLAGHFDLDIGNWTPVPRFLISEYIPAYPNSVLLLLLLQYQHISWKNSCWPGVQLLSRRIGWTTYRVSDALTTMSDRREWRALKTGLPRP